MNYGNEFKIHHERPFGGVAFLWEKYLSSNITVVKSDPTGTCLVINIKIGTQSILII